jgi:uncharacterized protein YfaT (DUF1175 family)
MPAEVFRAIAGAALLGLLLAGASLVLLHRSVLAEGSRGARVGAHALHDAGGAAPGLSWHDSLGDGFPDGARLDSVQDRENFTRWFTFLAETQYNSASPRTRGEIQDCAALVRFAYRNSLAAHSPAWREDAALPYDPGFGDIAKYHYPQGPLGRALFRSRPGPIAADDLAQGAFVEFADSATLLRYNTYLISRDVRAAAPGDLLFFHQPVQREPFHTMLFVGKSYYQQQGSDWIVYHTGEIDGHQGEIREVQTRTLLEHPDLHWRPLLSNPNFLGVYRLEILR